MTVLYNENDPFAAAWLRELIKEGVIAPGVVDERSIEDLTAADVAGFTQVHFFAGIGGWSYALRLAGWPDDKPVWTGSCPCQPFSAAGKRGGVNDKRHLWPEMRRLVAECAPPVVFGEQVAQSIGWGWLDLVSADLEKEGYAVGAAVLGAHSVGAPHVRQRLYFVADAAGKREREQADKADSITTGGNPRVVSSRDGKSLAYTDCKPQVRATVARSKCDSWPAEPSVGRVVDGLPHSVVAPWLKGFGNAIVPQVAAEFVSAYLDTLN